MWVARNTTVNFPQRASQITPKVVNLYSKLFKGVPVLQICGPNQTQDQFYAELLTLDVDWTFIVGELERVSGNTCLTHLKPFLSSWFKACIHSAHSSSQDDVKKTHALQTLAVIVRGIFAKSLSGWEVMEILAGSVNESDLVFTDFTDMIANIILDSETPANTRHLALQLALIYICGAGQTSLGSYFLRRDFLPIIISFVKNRKTGKFAFEAVLLLCVLVNFHRSDAARLNPYIRRLQSCEDIEFFEKINWAVDFALNASIQWYRKLSDDTSPQNLATGFVSLFASWRPDKALSASPIDPLKELFKDQPIEAAVALLAVFEMVNLNRTYPSILCRAMSSDNKREGSGQPSLSVALTTICLSSYVLTHASSSSSARALAYASLCLKTLLKFLENSDLEPILFQPTQHLIQLCRQRLPMLPIQNGSRPPVCAILDCCVLWFRHNLQYKLEVSSCLLAINIVQRVIWYSRCNRLRLEYEWKNLWSAILGLLNFIATKAESIAASIELGDLIEEAIALLEYALSQGENILPSSEALQEFIYELIRFSDSLRKLKILVVEPTRISVASTKRTAWISARSTEERLSGVLETVSFYEEKVSSARTKTAKDAMKVVAREIESGGLRGARPTLGSEPPKRVEDAIGFVRYGYSDILALMP